ncbi:hypothetical protein DPMN_149901 [Dreissena polymorpha]|uniref:Uncharacterized protein n=1 Tax=Dreissena polymorpha TaxID=45954 RepID=A0A9D4FDK3_DREPO|nr:hypothetical protein DPMN_149901 [Dreissena polymorpha]
MSTVLSPGWYIANLQAELSFLAQAMLVPVKALHGSWFNAICGKKQIGRKLNPERELIDAVIEH